MTNTAIPAGWNTARCSAGDQPRIPDQMTPAMPARPVAPPITPLTTPTAPSAAGPARLGELRPDQAIKAEQHQDRADRHAQARRRHPTQQLGADRHADRAADQERHHPPPVQRLTQLPDRDTLHDQTENDDQHRRLCRRQEMQPYRGRDNPEGEAGQAGDERRGKGAGDKQGDLER